MSKSKVTLRGISASKVKLVEVAAEKYEERKQRPLMRLPGLAVIGKYLSNPAHPNLKVSTTVLELTEITKTLEIFVVNEADFSDGFVKWKKNL